MSELVLHHYPASPFSEKVRSILGLKGLAWRSVRIPAVMPKPDVVALTGGYRKTPLLQIDNHVYCDTALIARVLEQRAPNPPLYAEPRAEFIAQWADSVLFEVAVTLARRPTKLDAVVRLFEPQELEKFRDDRIAMWGRGAAQHAALRDGELALPGLCGAPRRARRSGTVRDR